jgi:NAD(P)-dependent dehydrogenase (short-subunit alcohol dehydrogenase family)
MVRWGVASPQGANKGIGFDIARRLVEEGFAVKLTARTDTAGSDAVGRGLHSFTYNST